MKPITLELATDHPLLEAGAENKRVLEVRLRAPEKAQPGQRHPLNLALVLDRSGSMHGAKLDYVKGAAAYVLELLGAQDRVALVTYDDQVAVVAESTRVTAESKAELGRRIREVRSGGSTNLSGGWLEGCGQVAQHLGESSGQVDRALLLTDGLANAGITDVEDLAVHARALQQRGVSTSTFGVGHGFNEQLLEVMANNGGGNFTYIVSPVDIPDIFAREFGEMMDITARDVEIEITPPAGVHLDLLGSWQAEPLGGGLRILLGSMGAEQEKNLHLDLHFPALPAGSEVILGVKARGRAESGEILESQAELRLRAAPAEEVQAQAVDEELQRRAALARVSHISRKSLEMERQGMAAPGAAMLREALQANSPYLDPATQASYQQTAQRMQDGMDEAARKQSHYQAYLHSKGRRDAHFQARTGTGGMSSSEILASLAQAQAVRVDPARYVLKAPPAPVTSLTFDKVEGMLLGLAIGDALGNTTESRLPAERKALVGEVRDYLPNPHANGQAVGLPSDDTQMAFWTVEVLLQEGRLDPEKLAQRFSQERIYGIGSTVREFLRAFKDEGRPWQQAGRESAGNGAAMRIAPVVLPYLRQPTPDLWADAILAGMITHNDYASNAACTALAGMLWDLLNMHSAPKPQWWAERFYSLAAPLEGNTSYTARMPGVHYRGSVCGFVETQVGRALKEGWTTLQAGNTWGSGAYLLETLPTALFILARHAHDPQEAIVRAVNDTVDNDTIAALVGAMIGALHGKSALPERWVSGLLGRTNDRNDGHVQQLVEAVKGRFWG